MQRAVEEDGYFVIQPEGPETSGGITKRAIGEEYTSENTERLATSEAIGELLERMDDSEHRDA